MMETMWNVNGQKNSRDIREFYVNHWDRFVLPVPINLAVMQKLSKRIALFKDSKIYCPFKNVKKCQTQDMTEVIENIAIKTMKEDRKYNRKLFFRFTIFKCFFFIIGNTCY